MKTLAVITKVENGFTFYNEICRKTGKVMISDHMETSRFNAACSDQAVYGFELICKHDTDMLGGFVYVPAAVKNVLINLSNSVDYKTRYAMLNSVRKDLNLKWSDLPKGHNVQCVVIAHRLRDNYSIKFN